MQQSGNIYFPTNGVQPTTSEAIAYSCANVDNRENSPITEWYMKMFGVIDKNGGTSNNDNDYIHAGWSAHVIGIAIKTQRIIHFDTHFNGNDLVKDPDTGDIISRENFFIQKFRRIASTSVGRTLLYRLLIEIRRHQANNTGSLENGINPAHLLAHRNSSRSIEIRWGKFLYGYTHISIENFIIQLPSIGKSDNGYNHIVKYAPPLDVMLFHEMNHWYHHLRHPNRFAEESNCYGIGRRLDGNPTPGNGNLGTVSANAADLGAYYWQVLLAGDPQLAISEEAWKNPLSIGGATVYRVPFEEMRNILGVPINGIANKLNGDEISENLYRMCIGVPLRYGYWQSPTLSSTCYEDSRVIDKVVKSCTSYKEHYNCIPISLGKVDYEWGNASNQQGLGNFRIFLDDKRLFLWYFNRYYMSEEIMKVEKLIKATAVSVLQCFLVHASLAMNYYPQYSIPSTEAIRISELFRNMKLDEVYKAIDDGIGALDKVTGEDEILQTLNKSLNKVENFCQAVDLEDRKQSESSSVLLQLQVTKMIVLKVFFDLYKKAKCRLGTSANTVILKNEASNKLIELFGSI